MITRRRFLSMRQHEQSKHYYFIGIGGIGMSALASIMLDRGMQVSGSDLALSYVTEILNEAGAHIRVGHAEQNIKPGMTVVYATGVSESNPEIRAAKKLGCPVLHRTDLLMEIARDYRLFAVSGTHGKTTTSALLTHVLSTGGKEPAFAIGGVLPNYGRNGGDGKGSDFVIEACESDGTFLKFRPYGAIVTNIDADHLDHFGSEEAITQAFLQFIDNVSNPEFLFWCGDDRQLSQNVKRGISYGFEENCSLRISDFSQEGWKIRFDIDFKGKNYPKIFLPIIGRHNALNAAAVFGLALELGVDEELIRKGFSTFKGVKRRCEKKGEFGEMLFIDDYAHHPSELKTTLEGIRMAIGPSCRLVAIYQPHRYSRTRDCKGMYGAVFDVADQVILTSIYGAGESPIEGISDKYVFDDLVSSNTTPLCFVSKEDLLTFLQTYLQPRDVVVTLGAGDVTTIGSLFLETVHK